MGLDTALSPAPPFSAVGINIGFWDNVTIPETMGWINGLIVDLPLGVQFGYPNIGNRFMTVDMRKGFLEGDRIGYKVQVVYGRIAGMARYLGVQGLFPRDASVRTSLNVINTTTGSTSVAQGVKTTLKCTFTNTSGGTKSIAKGDNMLITMPSYFSTNEVGNMVLTAPDDNWTPTQSVLSMQCNNSNGINWEPDNPMVFDIEQVETDSNEQGKKPFVTVSIPNAVIEAGFLDTDSASSTSKLTLVPKIAETTINWMAFYPDFEASNDGSANSGSNIPVYTQKDPNTIVELFSVTGSDDTVWKLGYNFNFDEYDQLSFRAVWAQNGSFLRPDVNLWWGVVVGPNSTTPQTDAHFGGNTVNPNYIDIEVNFSN